MLSKRCTKCGEVKILSAFYNRVLSKDGLKPECKECSRKTDKEYKEFNKEKCKLSHKKYREKNRDILKQRSKEYREKNREKINKYNRYIYSNCKNHNKYIKNKHNSLVKDKKNRDNLTDCYIAQLLNIHIKDCPPELIEAKRMQLKLLRLVRES